MKKDKEKSKIENPEIVGEVRKKFNQDFLKKRRYKRVNDFWYKKVESIFSGFYFIVVGILLFFNMMEQLDWIVWWHGFRIYMQIWPLLIVWVGVRIFFGWKGPIRYLGEVLFFLVFLGVVLISVDIVKEGDFINISPKIEEAYPDFMKK